MFRIRCWVGVTVRGSNRLMWLRISVEVGLEEGRGLRLGVGVKVELGLWLLEV